MLAIENRTPFPAEIFSILSKTGREMRVLVIAATFVDERLPALAIAAEQEPIAYGDLHRGDPARSSVAREADIAMPKPLVDVIVDGCAYPSTRSMDETVVELRVGDIDKRLLVRGDNQAGDGRLPFLKMPVIYERAFGGTVTVDGAVTTVHRANPVGLGAHGAFSTDPAVRTQTPNIDHAPSTPGSLRNLPAGFGIVARGWQPRLALAGRYDAAWLARQWPLPPEDFDDLHYQCAPKDQQSSTIAGGETVTLTNMTPDRTWRFNLPRLQAPVHLVGRNLSRLLAPPRVDTIYLWPERRTVLLCARVALPASDPDGLWREVVLGAVTGGWLRARASRKPYRDVAGTTGLIAGRSCGP